MIGQKSTIAGIGRILSPWLKATVLNDTGLTGYYDFDVKWTALDAGDSGQIPDAMGLLISVLQTRFGLKLSKSQGPVRYMVVDHVEPPTEN